MKKHDPQTHTITGPVHLTIGNTTIDAEVTIPTRNVRVRHLLPLAQALTNEVVNAAERNSEEQGKAISCKAGCGACCRQMVPISRTEAFALQKLVREMPEHHHAELTKKFAEAEEAFRAAGLWDKFENCASWSKEELAEFGMRYFKMGIACPFLIEESCGIHPIRPISCRVYLVTTPAANCQNPGADNIERVPLPSQMWGALAKFDGPEMPWMPLIYSLFWASKNREPLPNRPGPEVLHEFLQNVTNSTGEAPAAFKV